MASGRVEIAYTGIQDVFLTDQPQFTYFQRVYKQHTKFALEVMDTPIDGAVGFGGTYVCTVPRMGDMIRTIYLRIVLSPIVYTSNSNVNTNATYVDSIGNALFEYADLVIGGQTIQRINGEFMEIYSDMWVSDSQQASIQAMTGKTYNTNWKGVANTGNPFLYIVPLPFYFYGNDSMAIPLSAITYQEVQVKFKFRDLSNLIYPVSQVAVSTASIQQMSMPIEFIFISTSELQYMQKNKLDYAISQIQMNPYTMNVGDTYAQMQLTFLNPVRELYIIIQYQSAADANQLFNYTDAGNDILKNIELNFNNETRIMSDIANYLYLRKAQPLMFHTRSPTRFIYSYSFSIYPEKPEPSGQTNMSRIFYKNLNITTNSIPKSSGGAQIRVYARSFNILRIKSGLAGVVFIDNNFY